MTGVPNFCAKPKRALTCNDVSPTYFRNSVEGAIRKHGIPCRATVRANDSINNVLPHPGGPYNNTPGGTFVVVVVVVVVAITRGGQESALQQPTFGPRQTGQYLFDTCPTMFATKEKSNDEYDWTMTTMRTMTRRNVKSSCWRVGVRGVGGHGRDEGKMANH
eukprot:scaffold158318_cov56-Attheya_sp.AAC.1